VRNVGRMPAVCTSVVVECRAHTNSAQASNTTRARSLRETRAVSNDYSATHFGEPGTHLISRDWSQLQTSIRPNSVACDRAMHGGPMASWQIATASGTKNCGTVLQRMAGEKETNPGERVSSDCERRLVVETTANNKIPTPCIRVDFTRRAHTQRAPHRIIVFLHFY